MSIKINEPSAATDATIGSHLVRPGDITDAIDSRDLLDQIITANTKAIIQKVDKRIVAKWLADKKKEQKSVYVAQAKEAYNKLWAICSDKTVGHNFRNLDVRGYTIKQCDDCKFAKPSSKDDITGYFATETKTANSMNNDQINALADRMIELDIEAGIFTWATQEDYPNIVYTPPKKRRFFRS